MPYGQQLEMEGLQEWPSCIPGPLPIQCSRGHITVRPLVKKLIPEYNPHQDRELLQASFIYAHWNGDRKDKYQRNTVNFFHFSMWEQ